MNRTQFRTRIGAATIVIGAVFALSGCYNGFGATTNLQSTQSTGNGVQAQVGAMKVENATLVRGDDGSSATLIMTVVNIGDAADAVAGVQVNGVPAVFTDGTASVGPVVVEPGAAIPFGYGTDDLGATRWVNVYTVEIPASGFVPVQVFFDDAGLAELEVLTVPPTGIYDGITVEPASPV